MLLGDIVHEFTVVGLCLHLGGGDGKFVFLIGAFTSSSSLNRLRAMIVELSSGDTEMGGRNGLLFIEWLLLLLLLLMLLSLLRGRDMCDRRLCLCDCI